MLESRLQPRDGVGPDTRVLHAECSREIHRQLALAAGVVDRDELARRRAARLLEERQACGELVERVDRQHAITVVECAIGRVIARDCAAVRECHRSACRRAPDFEHHDGNLPKLCFVERCNESGRVAHGFQEKPDDPRLRLSERVIEVVGGARDQLLPG